MIACVNCTLVIEVGSLIRYNSLITQSKNFPKIQRAGNVIRPTPGSIAYSFV